jgi:hypothetical protein
MFKRLKRGPRSSGIYASGRSVHGEVVLPSIRRPILSQPLRSPSRISPFKPRLCVCRASSHGLAHNDGRIQRCERSSKCQRTRRSACLSRELPSSLGLVSW